MRVCLEEIFFWLFIYIFKKILCLLLEVFLNFEDWFNSYYLFCWEEYIWVLIFIICYVMLIVLVMVVWYEVVIDLIFVYVYINMEIEWEV